MKVTPPLPAPGGTSSFGRDPRLAQLGLPPVPSEAVLTHIEPRRGGDPET
jgi:hypothetical protein